MINPLIYGKAGIQKIVAIEVKDDTTTLFKLNENFDIETEERSNKYWILSNEPHDKNWARLHGNLHYKYGRQFTERTEFLKFRQILKNHDIYSVYDPREACMMKDGYTLFQGLKPKDVPTLSFDLETTGLNPENDDAKVLLISNTFRKNGKTIKKLFSYDEYSSQAELIETWTTWVREIDPSIITGHNIFGFDLNYLLGIAKKELTTVDLGRDGSPITQEAYTSDFRVDGSRDMSYSRIHCYGRQLIDTMFLAYRYDIVAKKYESYGLKSIIKTEGLEKENRAFYDASQIRFKYTDPVEWAKIKEYCVDDSDDGLALFDLMSPAQFYMTQSIPRTFQAVHESATGAQINGMMVRSYLQDKHSLPKADFKEAFQGALTVGNSGVYRWVKKVDVASLYPSIMIEYEVFDKDKDPKEYFKVLVKTFTDLRLEYKKKAKEDKYYDDLQGAFKILINSCYGFLSTAGLNFNSVKKAAFVTEKGREILTKCIDWAAKKNYLLVNADTDSISYCKADMSEFTKEEVLADLKEINSMYPSRISWEDDGYYKCVVVLASKNYILQTVDGKVKLKGSGLKDAKKPPALKEMMRKMIQSILDDTDNFREIYEEYVQEALNIKDIRRWCSKKTISDKVLNAERTTEQKILDTIKDTEYVEGDRIYTYFKPDGTLGLAEKYDGVYDKAKLLQNLNSCVQIFDVILNCDEIFPNYSLGKYFNKLCPEQAIIRKQLAAQKRKEAKIKKDLKDSKESVTIDYNDDFGNQINY